MNKERLDNLSNYRGWLVALYEKAVGTDDGGLNIADIIGSFEPSDQPIVTEAVERGIIRGDLVRDDETGIISFTADSARDTLDYIDATL